MAFWGRRSSSDSATDETCEGPKYEHPRVLLVDVKDNSEKLLKDAGFNVQSGTFGARYTVPMEDTRRPVCLDVSLPAYTEQEVVVIDLAPHDAVPEPRGSKETSPGAKDWWASCSRGFIDPRPRAMAMARPALDRSLAHGAVFIVFADSRGPQDITLTWEHYPGRLDRGEPIHEDSWSFLTTLDEWHLQVRADVGGDVCIQDKTAPCAGVLDRHLGAARFLCTVCPRRQDIAWLPLATSSFGDPVAGLMACPTDREGILGFVLVVPQVREKGPFLVDLLQTALPSLAPHLFPCAEGVGWIHDPDYEIPRAVEMRTEIGRIKAETESRVAEIEADPTRLSKPS